jgi:glycoside/pentoside/hexuronide:cation symporter, GPH family
MDQKNQQTTSKTPWSHILGYAIGEGGVSLTMNGIAGFAMLFYTQAMGLPFAFAGLAFSVASFWDAFADPLMGHLTDNTRSRWGRRHSYILVGGLLMAIGFYYIWNIPTIFRTGTLLFVYVFTINILFRSAYTIFSIPYMALGFEVCTDYHQRSHLQSARSALNMLVNLLGPALAWSIFFPDIAGGPEATSTEGNFIRMGTVFAIATAIFTVIVVWTTRRHIVDSRNLPKHTGQGLRVLYRDSIQILTDGYLRLIAIFSCIGTTGAIFVSTIQMYLYVYLMHLTALEKTLTHGGGMILCGLGAIVGSPLARRFDKKYAVCIGASITVTANLLAAIIFLGGILEPRETMSLAGYTIPLAVIVFAVCNMINWFGNGVFMTLANSMIADVAEVNELKSGVRKDGGYAAIFAFISKLVASLSTFIASACLAWVGFVPGSDQQTPESIRWLVFLTFGLGAIFAFLVIPIALRYPISQQFMTEVKTSLAKKREQTSEGEVVPIEALCLEPSASK